MRADSFPLLTIANHQEAELQEHVGHTCGVLLPINGRRDEGGPVLFGISGLR